MNLIVDVDRVGEFRLFFRWLGVLRFCNVCKRFGPVMVKTFRKEQPAKTSFYSSYIRPGTDCLFLVQCGRRQDGLEEAPGKKAVALTIFWRREGLLVSAGLVRSLCISLFSLLFSLLVTIDSAFSKIHCTSQQTLPILSLGRKGDSSIDWRRQTRGTVARERNPHGGYPTRMSHLLFALFTSQRDQMLSGCHMHRVLPSSASATRKVFVLSLLQYQQVVRGCGETHYRTRHSRTFERRASNSRSEDAVTEFECAPGSSTNNSHYFQNDNSNNTRNITAIHSRPTTTTTLPASPATRRTRLWLLPSTRRTRGADASSLGKHDFRTQQY